jgi:hypothetical protein
MQINVFDTLVTHKDGRKMHFDVLLPKGSSQEKAKACVAHWLDEINIQTDSIKLDKCTFCHYELATPEIDESIHSHGYAILQMEGCPAPVN